MIIKQINQKLLAAFYTNPLIDDDFPDPSVIYVAGRGYFAYATHDAFSPTLNNILVRRSPDMVHWSAAEGALLSSPVWAKDCKRFWCPHVVQVNKEFRLYYAAEPDTKDGMCLAMATSDAPVGFTDSGKPLSRLAGSTYQMIDPCLFIDPVSHRHLLYYGSAHEPIRVVELEGDGKTFKADPVEVLYPGEESFQRLREGTFVTYNRAWKRYFLWVSGDNTWDETAYAVSLFWSGSPVAGFTKIPGEHVVLRSNARWGAPGQNCVITDAAGNEWMIYHAVDIHERFIAGTNIVLRKMCMDRIWYTDEGWPYIHNGSPSYEERPAPEGI